MIGRRLTVLDEADRWLFRVLLVVSVYVMVRGHNAPANPPGRPSCSDISPEESCGFGVRRS